MKLHELSDQILALAVKTPRVIVGIAGPPASGKSTFAQQLVDQIDSSILVPMDGFHLDNDMLDQMGQRSRKGAPHTFDAHGFIALVEAIKQGEFPVKVPEFDRQLDRVVDGTQVVQDNHKIVVVEGNYLLLNQEPWSKLTQIFDLTVLLKPSLQIIEDRIIKRWLDMDFSYKEALSKAEMNDLPNARYVLEASSSADIVLEGSY